MMATKSIVFFFLLLTFCNAKSQSDSIDYTFLNQAIRQLPTCGNNNFRMFDQATSGWISENSLDGNTMSNRLRDLKSVIDSNKLREIIRNSHLMKKERSVKIEQSRLKEVNNAKIINAEDSDSFKKNGGCIGVFSCSAPVFDTKKEYGVLYWCYRRHNSIRAEQSRCYLFRNVNNHWKMIGSFDYYEY